MLRIVSVLSVALAAGHLVETLRANSAIRTQVAAQDRDGSALIPADAEGGQGATLPRSASLSSGGFSDFPTLMGITAVSSTPDPAGNPACSPVLSLAAAADAMIDLTLDAPCNRGQRVVIRHGGLSFTARTGPDGKLALRLPALEADALVTTYLEGASVVLAKVEVPEVADLVRFAFQAPFPVQFDLRAEEAGQVYSGKGTSSARDGSRKILSLGSPAVSEPILAQVYTFPAATPETVDLTVEVRINADTCSRTFQAETVLSRAGSAEVTSLPVAVPLCGTSGDILVLKNLVSDPTLTASN